MLDFRHDVIGAVKEFLLLIEEPGLAAATRLARLRGSLDHLAYLQHVVTYATDERDHAEPPTPNYKELRSTVAGRFPNLGCYNLPTPLTKRIGEAEIAVADAIDDITDIASDLYGVLWRAENTSLEDALWHFQHGFNTHWGEHLRGLQLHLHRLPAPSASKGQT